MPLEYSLEKKGTIVMARAIGVLTLDCFRSMMKEMTVDPNLQDQHNTLLDARSVSKIELTEDDLNTIAQELTSGPRTLGAEKLGIVARHEQAFDLGKKYQTVDKDVEETVIVFFNIDIARMWIGLDE